MIRADDSVESAGIARLRKTGRLVVLGGQLAIVLAIVARVVATEQSMGGALPALLLLLASGLVARLLGTGVFARMTLSVGLMAQVMLLVSAFAEHRYQMDMHMAFFAALGLIAFCLCWQSIVASTLAVALHHLTLNFLMPSLVFIDGTDIARVLVHAAILLIEAGALLLLVQLLCATMRASDNATQVAREALAESAAHAGSASGMRAEIDEGRQALQQAVRAFSDTIGATTGSAERAVREMLDAATRLDRIAGSSGKGVDDAAIMARETAANVGAAAGSAGELSKSIAEIAGQVQSTSETVTSVRSAGEASLQRMNELTAASEKIGNVVTLIQAIAGQTNLLALNATIEAARAGETGRGFAVVASEVKSLAAQTGRATDEIAQQIQSVQKATGESANAIKAIVGRMVEVDQFMASIAAAIEEQDQTTRGMSETMVAAANNSSLSNERIAGLRAETQEIGEVARAVLTCADAVQKATRGVHDEVARFARTNAA